MHNDVGRIANVLLIEDDEEDQWATQRAFEKSLLRIQLFMVSDGQKALDYLYNRRAYEDRQQFPRPDLILLDLNLPVLDGRTVLQTIKDDDNLRTIPVVVLTTSAQEQDILRSYDIGVNSYITKPVNFESFMETIREMGKYWLELVVLPPKT